MTAFNEDAQPKRAPVEKIGALKLACTNIRTYQEGVEDKELYAILDEIIFSVKDVIDEAGEPAQ